MLGRLHPTSYARAVWFVHPTCMPALYGLVVTIRNQGDTDNVGSSFAGVTQSDDGTLRIYGLPVIPTDACPVLGQEGDVLLGDWSAGYFVGMREGATIAVDTSVKLDFDAMCFRFVLRRDGQPLASAPVKLRDGTSTVSRSVALGSRSS